MLACILIFIGQYLSNLVLCDRNRWTLLFATSVDDLDFIQGHCSGLPMSVPFKGSL